MTAPVPDVAGWLTRQEETHQAATKGRVDYPSRPWLEQNPDEPQEIEAVWSDGARMVIGECFEEATAAAIVAEHNSFGALLAVARGVLALAETWTRYPQSPEDRERNRYGAAMEDCGGAIAAAVAAARAAGEAAATQRWMTARDALAEEWEGGHAEALASMRALHFAERPAMAEAYGYRANAYASAAARLRGLVTTSSEEEQ